MRITQLIISGFRSFSYEPVSIEFPEKLSAFIGLNSAGKTSALEAFRKLFGSALNERNIVKEDFHIPFDEEEEEDERKLYIEAEIKFGKDIDSVPHFFSQMVIEKEKAEPYIRIRLEATWTATSLSPDGQVDLCTYFVKAPFGASETSENKQVFPNHLRGLIQVLYVPAIRKPSEQIRYASGSILYRILRRIKWDDSFKDSFQEHVDDISELFREQKDVGTIETSIKGFWNRFHKDQRYTQADLTFGGNDFESVLKKLEIAFSPSSTGRPYKVDDLGEGYRSLFYLTLVCSMLEIEETVEPELGEIGITRPLLTILAIEEPENHIAPQLLGRVISILKLISEKENTQVLLSSHTPAIIKRIKPESICHFQITKEFRTLVNRILLPPKEVDEYKYVKEAIQNYPEIYFAKLVVIGEGDSEDVIFNRFMKIKNVDFDDNIVSFAPLGHRFVNHIWKLLDVLNIPHVTLLDLDLGRNGGGWGRIQYILRQLIAVGHDSKELLKTEDGKQADLDKMDEWEVSDTDQLKELMSWVKFLRDYNVYYSTPLDLDFLMLSQYPEAYKGIIPAKGGPRIPDKSKAKDKYDEKVKEGVASALKSVTANDKVYTDEEKELMIWYTYHFLNRGKPATHIEALSKLGDEAIGKNFPPLFESIFKRISKLLGS